MNIKELSKHIRKGNYELKIECECDTGCNWRLVNNMGKDRLVCVISNSKECWTDRCLYVDGQFIAYQTYFTLNVSDGAGVTLDELQSILKKYPKFKNELCKIPEKFKNCQVMMVSNKKITLIEYLKTLHEERHILFIDLERNFANEYTCIIVAASAKENDIPENAYEVDIETWTTYYLHAHELGDVEYCIKFRYIK